MQVFDDPLFPGPKRQTQLDYKSPSEDGVQKLVPELSKPVPGKKKFQCRPSSALVGKKNDVAHAVNSPPRCPAAELMVLSWSVPGWQSSGQRERDQRRHAWHRHSPSAMPFPPGTEHRAANALPSITNHTAPRPGTNQDRIFNPASEKRSAQLWWRKD